MKPGQPKALNNFSIVDQIELRLREYFKKENLQPGDSLPYESDLAKSMGVSRTALREALARLKTLGLIESKRNRGIILTQPDILGNIERVLEPTFLDSKTLQDVFELRLVLELGISELLFLRKTPDKLQVLQEIVEREEKTDDKFVRNRCDVDFHATLYEISGNKTIQRFQKILLPIFIQVYNGTFVRRTKISNPVTHRHLLEELQQGNSSQYREKIKTHLQVYFDSLEAESIH